MSYPYIDDIRAVNELVQSGPRSFASMLRFVVASIQQQLETVPRIIDSYLEDGPDSQYAFGFKRDSLVYIEENSRELYLRAMDALGGGNDTALMLVFLDVPGLGLAKAGFCAQLLANRIGCIDTHNLKLYGEDLTIRYPKSALYDTRVKHIHRYIELCRACGGSTSLWSRWCHFVHKLRPANWANGGEVSYFHYSVISGEWAFDADKVLRLEDLEYTPKFLWSRIT